MRFYDYEFCSLSFSYSFNLNTIIHWIMSTNSKRKHSGGSSCAVATCKNYASKTKEQGFDISFHRFPIKNVEIYNMWVHKCRRGDKWNPKTSLVCSKHFTQDSFVRDLKAELLGYTPKVRLLKPDAVPTLYLPPDHSQSVTSSSAINRNKRIEAKSMKQVHDELILSSITSTSPDSLSPSIEISSTINADSIPFPDKSPLNMDYEQLYNDLLRKHNELKVENDKQKDKILSLEEPLVDYKKINECLRTSMNILQKQLNSTNSLLKTTQKTMSEEVKILSQNKNKSVENEAKKLVSSVFSQNQLNLILKKKKRVHWTRDEVAKAFTLRYLSKRSYVYVKNELHYPLPGLSSLQRWAKTIEMRNGILDDVLKIMKLNGDRLKDHEKLTVLMFDEVKISSTVEYDVLHDEFIGPHNQMQVVMARGISSQWKQPIFVDFDKKITKDILFDIIEKLDEIGFKVICCVSDCGGGNIGLWKALDINYQNPVFSIPNGRQVVYIPDAPHILKLVRNWLLDTGFSINDKIINKKPLEALVSFSSTELSVCYKLTKEHLSCEGPQRQRVKLATQLLSHTTATALLHYKPINDTKLNNDTAHFIELINNWFDLANVCHSNDKRTPYTAPYGVCLEEQDALLNEVYETVLNMRCIGKQNLQLFQKALLMNINGTKLLLQILIENNLKYLLTSKINQDALENLFSQLRSRGGLNDHPSPLNALHRLRMIILGKNPGIVSSSSNTTDQNQEEFLVAAAFKQVDFNVKGEFEIPEHQENMSNDSETDTASENESQVKESRNNSEMTNDAVEYLAGWVAKKHKLKFPEIGSITSAKKPRATNDHDYLMPSWISHLSYGGLITPSKNFKANIFRVERLFKKITKQLIPKGSGVVRRLTDRIFKRTEIEQKYKPVIQSYVKQRLLIRMKYYNQHAVLLAKKRKAKAQLSRIVKLRKLMT